MTQKFLVSLVGLCLLPSVGTALADGWYGGIQGGYNTVGVQKSNTIFLSQATPAPLGTTPNYTRSTSFAEGGLAGLYVGYGKREGRIYLGAELDGSLNTARANTKDDLLPISTSVKEKLKETIGLSVLGGYYLTDSSLLYGRAGGVWSRFESNSRSVSYYEANGSFNKGLLLNMETYSAGYSGASGDFSKGLLGARLGLGMEIYVTQHISVRGEYDYTFYERFSKDSLLPFAQDPDVGLIIVPTTSRYTIRSHQFMLGLSYHFT